MSEERHSGLHDALSVRTYKFFLKLTTAYANDRAESGDRILISQISQTETALREATEYSNSTKFRSLLRDLHRERLIFYEPDGPCLITPKGVLEAERLLLRVGLAE